MSDDDDSIIEVKLSFEDGDPVIAILKDEFENYSESSSWSREEIDRYESGKPTRWVESVTALLTATGIKKLSKRIGDMFGSSIKVDCGKVSIMVRNVEQLNTATESVLKIIKAQNAHPPVTQKKPATTKTRKTEIPSDESEEK
jgi:hypothetical protein